ncbi:hypothetical protein H920_02657 [Fukomys damarensis]|uniref:Uncharacterized protein n=1 Tax=Fukomys damarensis TaxID=885580 RepID=A0A091E041_FUKDA|nr:hypothetical protein H920_02657 [Fukomys damarensis]
MLLCPLPGTCCLTALMQALQMGTQYTESLAELCTVSTVQAGPPHTMMELLEQDFPERKSRSTSSVFDSSPELISQANPQDELVLNQLEPPEPAEAEPHGARFPSTHWSTSSVLDSSLELISLLDSCHELLDQLEPPEAPEAEPQGKENSGPAPVHTEVPPGELMPAPPAAPSAALAPQQEPVPGSPAPPAAELELLVSPQLNGNHSADSLAELCSVSTVQAGPAHTVMEPLEQDFPDRNSRSSSSAVPDSSLEWNSQIDFIDELLLDQLEPTELPEAEPQDEEDGGMGLCICGPVVPALDHAEVPPADLVPPPPVAPSAALAPQQEPAPGSPAPPATQLELLDPQQGSSLELHLSVSEAELRGTKRQPVGPQ